MSSEAKFGFGMLAWIVFVVVIASCGDVFGHPWITVLATVLWVLGSGLWAFIPRSMDAGAGIFFGVLAVIASLVYGLSFSEHSLIVTGLSAVVYLVCAVFCAAP